MFTLKLFGGASLHGPHGRLEGPASQKHRLAVLALLANSAGRRSSRQRVMAYLWPERDTAHAANLLNQCVYIIRQALGRSVIMSRGDDLDLDDRRLSVDINTFEKARARDEFDLAAGCYAGPFLDGFFVPEAPEFGEWIAGERERLRRAYLSVLESLAECAEAAGDRITALSWWHRLSSEEPHAARFVVRLMHALEQSGDRAAALRVARAHTAQLLHEFEAEANPEVARLAERMRTMPRDPGSGS